jgi:hypothetical protein
LSHYERYLRNLECFREIDRHSYIIWTDCGPHFRCAEMMHYCFKELLDFKIKVSLNYFCEKHGKSSRDQHFSVVSHFIRKESMIRRLTSSQDICDAIERQQAITNSKNALISRLSNKNDKLRRHDFKEIITKLFVIPQLPDSVLKKSLYVIGIKSFYNFFTDNHFVLKSRLMSDGNNYTLVQVHAIKEKNEPLAINQNKKSDKIEPVFASSLIRRINKWNELQRNSIRKDSSCSEDSSSSEDVPIELEHLNFCTKKCEECHIAPKFRMDDFKNLKLFQINEELKLHGHPKSRQIKIKNKIKNRNIITAKKELFTHYQKYHY